MLGWFIKTHWVHVHLFKKLGVMEITIHKKLSLSRGAFVLEGKRHTPTVTGQCVSLGAVRTLRRDTSLAWWGGCDREGLSEVITSMLGFEGPWGVKQPESLNSRRFRESIRCCSQEFETWEWAVKTVVTSVWRQEKRRGWGNPRWPHCSLS